MLSATSIYKDAVQIGDVTDRDHDVGGCGHGGAARPSRDERQLADDRTRTRDAELHRPRRRVAGNLRRTRNQVGKPACGLTFGHDAVARPISMLGIPGQQPVERFTRWSSDELGRRVAHAAIVPDPRAPRMFIGSDQ
jgi:hypothetical protein